MTIVYIYTIDNKRLIILHDLPDIKDYFKKEIQALILITIKIGIYIRIMRITWKIHSTIVEL